MRGSKRLRKKMLKQSGWDVVEKTHDGQGGRLELCGPEGKTLVVENRTSPQLFNQALEKVKAGAIEEA